MAGLLGAALLLAGCAETGQTATQGAEGPPAPISDPVVAFAASAGPGAEETVTLPSTGQTVRLRLVRAYAAASGRECREVQMGTGTGSASRLLCSAGTGWREARPLIRGGTGTP
ncbi:DVU3141 family protein [Roseomonas sp. CAU 1739]|uniref:DVU3141 family protein n=1 Tax=Roseomonas sp. CAU 1739 TaxID=3140364 RepID=UPI00325BCD7D